MSKEWPSALDRRIAADKADPISDQEKAAAARLKATYEELFGSSAQKSAVNLSAPAKRSTFGKIVRTLGLSS